MDETGVDQECSFASLQVPLGVWLLLSPSPSPRRVSDKVPVWPEGDRGTKTLGF